MTESTAKQDNEKRHICVKVVFKWEKTRAYPAASGSNIVFLLNLFSM